MTKFDDIYEIAADNYGLVTYAEAKAAGVAGSELNRYVSEGRLAKVGHGLYKLTRWVPTENDSYAEAVALVGNGAYLFGESVIAMNGLAPTNPAHIDVATPSRVRRKLPGWLRVTQRQNAGDVTSYEGIASQSIVGAIRSCKDTLLPERLLAAAREARAQGLIRQGEADELVKRISETPEQE